MRNTRTTKGALAALAGMTLGLGALAATTSHGAAAQPAEDMAAWNCYTMGDMSCGGAGITFPGEGGSVGTVLPKASDTGRATVAWSSGAVWGTEGEIEVPRWWRYVSWRDCVENAEGGDASMAACDADWMYSEEGERFDMSEAHCYAEAWINDDPDAEMLAVCEPDA